MGCRDFGLDDGDCHGEEAYSEALDRSPDDEGCEAWSKDLDKGGEEIYQTTETNSPLATDHVTKTSSNKSAHSGGSLQTSDGYSRDRRVDCCRATICTTIITEEASDEYRVDQQARHDA